MILRLSDQLFDLFQGIGNKFLRQNKVIGNKIKKTKIPEKIKIGTEVTVDKLKKAGTFIANKFQPGLQYTQSKLILLKDKIIGGHDGNNNNIKEKDYNDLGAPIESSGKEININNLDTTY